MGATEPAAAIDGDKLMQFVFCAVDEIGATLNTALVLMGDRPGFYRLVAGAGPLASAELTGRTRTAERGEGRSQSIITAGGCTRLRRAAETPFNLVIEARP